MKKSWKILITTAAICILCSGCGSVRAAEPSNPKFVSRVEVSYRNHGFHLLRVYTDTDKIDAVLFYLYGLAPDKPAEADPERIQVPNCKITVILSNGETHIYRQRGNRYLSMDCRPWQIIDSEKADRLFPILARMCSDQ